MKKHIALAVVFAALCSACAGVRGVPIFTNERLPSGGLAISVAAADKDARAEGERAGAGQFASRLKTELENALSQGGFVVLPVGSPKVEAALKVSLSGALGAAGTPEKVRAELSGKEASAVATSAPWPYYKDALFGDDEQVRGELARAVALELANQLIEAKETRVMVAGAEERRIVALAARVHEPVRAPSEKNGRPLAYIAFAAGEQDAAFAGALQTLLLYDLLEHKCARVREVSLSREKAALCKSDECLRVAAKLSKGEELLTGSYVGEGLSRTLHLKVLGESDVRYEQELSLPVGEVSHRLKGASKALSAALSCSE